MKTTAFKKLIKESVKEVFQEELKELLLEAVRSQKSTPINENYTPTLLNENYNPTPISQPPINTPKSHLGKRNGYLDILEQTKLNFTSKDVPQRFNPQVTDESTSTNGTLPGGEVEMDQIMNLLNK